MASQSPLQELLLSSTSSTSPLPTTQLHSILTGSLLFSFKAPVIPGSTSTATNKLKGSESGAGSDVTGLDARKSMGFVEGSEGVGGMLLGLGGKEGRAGINVWGFQKEQVLQRLIPPARLSTLCLSNTGAYLAGGTFDGRIFFWEVSSGTLLLTIDAHYRPVSVLEFSHDDSALVSGGEDAGVSVWSVGRLMNATPMEPPTPFASLTDHTLAITAIAVGLGTFPHCRILTASLDSTCKIWDLSTDVPSLLSTFSFPSPITHVVWDPLERFFFAAGSTSAPASSSVSQGSSNEVGKKGSKVMRVDLYRKRLDEMGYETIEAIGGGGRGEIDSITQVQEYVVSDTITSLHLSRHSPSLLLGTSTSTIHLLSLTSLIPTRIIPPPLASTSPGSITFLSTLLRPSDLGSASTSVTGEGLPQRVVMKNGMGRTVRGSEWSSNGGKNGRTCSVRIGLNRDVREMGIKLPSLVSLTSRTTGGAVGGGGRSGGKNGHEEVKTAKRVNELEAEVMSLRTQLGKAIGLNDAIWKRVVEGTLNADDRPKEVPMELER